MGAHKYRKGEIDALQFNELPQRCKEIFFEYIGDCIDGITQKDDGGLLFPYIVGFWLPEEISSPIEKIFYFAFDIINFDREGADNPGLFFDPQVEIHANGKRYFADFVFDYYGDGNPGYYLEPENKLKLIVECDGHEFHEKTKEQVQHDNERDYDLKMAGYDVLHYSGSQIYNDPFKCAKEVYDYIAVKSGGWKKVPVGGNNGNL